MWQYLVTRSHLAKGGFENVVFIPGQIHQELKSHHYEGREKERSAYSQQFLPYLFSLAFWIIVKEWLELSHEKKPICHS